MEIAPPLVASFFDMTLPFSTRNAIAELAIAPPNPSLATFSAMVVASSFKDATLSTARIPPPCVAATFLEKMASLAVMIPTLA